MKKTQTLIACAAICFSAFASAADVVGVIGAMDSEIQKLLPEIDDKKEVSYGGHRFYTGELRGQDVVAQVDIH